MYLQNVLGTGPMETGLAFLPIAISTGLGAHVGSHLIGHAGPRRGMALAFILVSVGTMLLSRLDASGSYVADVLPGIVIAGFGLGIALVGVALSVLTGAAAEEAGMLSGLNTTGHEVGGAIGIAVMVSIATGSATATPVALANGIGDVFLVASVIAAVGAIVGALLLPHNAHVPAQAQGRPAGRGALKVTCPQPNRHRSRATHGGARTRNATSRASSTPPWTP